VSDIGPATPVDRHTVEKLYYAAPMYARLAEEGLVVENHADIKTFPICREATKRPMCG